jgi:uncharacterized protein
MLIEFSVANYKSFREKVTLSMVAAAIKSKDRSVDENNVIEVDQKLKLLTSAAIYGANASGKSNFIYAMDFMTKFVQNSAKDTQASEKIPTDGFRLSTEFDQKPSHFEVVFIMEGKRYRYGFEVNTDRIISEWLYYAPKAREATLFERDLEDIHVGNYFKEGKGKGLIQKTRENALFLSVVAQWNGEVSTHIVAWFQQVMAFINMESAAPPYFAFDDEEMRRSTLQLIKALDIDILDFSVEGIPSQDSTSSVSTAQSSSTKRRRERKIIKTRHQKYDEAGNAVDTVEFLLMESESHGTQKLFVLSPFLIFVLKVGLVLFLDELEAKLHPMLTRRLIQLFNDKETNPNNAQLIFTSHDTNLLSHDYFRRDQIWFTEKDKYGATHLYSLAEFKVRNDASFSRDYVHGKYGAIPFIGNLEYLFGTKGE